MSCPPYNGTKVSIEGPGSDDHDGMRQGDRWNPDPSTHEHQRIEHDGFPYRILI